MAIMWDRDKGTRMHGELMTKWQNTTISTGTLNKDPAPFFCTWDSGNGISGFEKFTTWDFWQLCMVIRFVQDVSKIHLPPMLFAYTSKMYMQQQPPSRV
jgi:hypothetical protein